MKAVILAGGKGTRLAPYTKVLPKPLMPIGDMPILEILLRQMKLAGVDEAILAVGHLSGLLRAFFQDGADLFDLIGLSQFLEERLQRPVDVVPRRALREELRDAVLQEVIIL